jgi:hypothetical protein
LALRARGSDLGLGRYPPLVAEKQRKTNMTAQDQPIACTLAGAALEDRRAWIAALTRDALRGYDRDDLVLNLRYAPEAASRVREMMLKEQACCGFLAFEMYQYSDEVQLTIRAPEDARASVDVLFRPFIAGARSATTTAGFR